MYKLIRNGNLYDVNSGEFSKRDLLIKNDKIYKIEHSIDVEEAEIIDASGKSVFPGFIDGHSHIGMWTEVSNGNDANECVNPVTPTMRAIDGLNPFDKGFQVMREEGFTTIMITPGSGNAICGQAAIIKSSGNTVSEMVVKEYAAFKIALGENPKGVYGPMNMSPSSRMGTAYVIENTLKKAKTYYEKRINNLTEEDLELEPFIPVFKGDIPLKIHCHRADDICTAIRIIDSFSLRYTLDHCTEGYMIRDVIKASKAPVMLGPMFMFRTKVETANSSLENLMILNKEGCNVSFISDHPFLNAKYLVKLLSLAVKEGLPYKDAIRMVSINPAKALEIDHRVGSLEVGKDADIVIYDGDPLESISKNYMTLINGNIVYKSNQN